ncbi:2-hydroxychromene-2-carboxylate isomerase [Alsobacter sp. SYSU M60028]|uniref:2-hydroxychromene-2-carboxylate isomerase n=1 Tax=Alsobacter ponti TaxID=2962936 RepID=A0ABT1LDB7_9HYPH|nr:2-hydroxychromene-2-carboxylate isomerase [Alsobacter ponti]MCP8938888.1 2-hydroxychromene-2-carboxylate isomerase [Alsobacter ponti]
MTEQPVVDFWYEFSSPYSFLAAERIGPLAEARGVRLVWRPFLLGAVFKHNGLERSPNLAVPAKTRYMWRDVERRCERMGLPFRVPDAFPLNGLSASRVAVALPDEARPAFTRAVYRAAFCEGRDIAEPAVVEEALREAGVDFEPALAAAHTELVKHALRRQTDAAVAKGVFGAPTLVTPDGELFWGNDRLEEALDWALGTR